MSERSAIGVTMIGCGVVGGGVGRVLRDHADLHTRRLGRPIELRRVLVLPRDVEPTKSGGLVDTGVVTDNAETFFATDASITIELAGGRGVISDFVKRTLNMKRHVVTANKALLAEEGPELFALARRNGVSIAFEASCGGGIPCITSLLFGLMANRVDGLYGILNGTCNYILTEMTRNRKDYATALREAQEKGFAEADPTFDVSGKDTAHKLAILSSLAFGVQLLGSQVPTYGIDSLKLDDIRFGAELGYDIKLLALAERDGDAVSVSVQPCFVHDSELLAQVSGAFNAVSVYGSAVGHTLYYGAGAGRMPTASAVVSDVLNIASGWYPKAFADMALTPDLHPPAKLIPAEQIESRFYIRLNAKDQPGVMAQLTKVLGDAGISLSAVSQHESAAGQFVPVVVTTHKAQQGALRSAIDRIEKLDVISGRPVVIRIVQMKR